MTSKTTELFLEIKPQAASRVRVTRFGSYHTKNYTEFREQCWFMLNKLKAKYPANDSCYGIKLEFIMKKPQKPANKYPIMDLDNLEKAILDALIHCQLFMIDDVQVIKLSSTKRYQRSGEPFGIRLKVTEYSEEEMLQMLT